MNKTLEQAIKAKAKQLGQNKKMPNTTISENFLAYVIERLDLDVDRSISAWLDDDEYWNEKSDDD